MRVALEAEVERGRVLVGRYRTEHGTGPMGKFLLMCPVFGRKLSVIATDARYEEGTPEGHPAYAWEHVSVAGDKFTPNWEEMCWIKDQFWLPEEPALQFHPPKSEWVNVHPFCLHLWALVPGKYPADAHPFLQAFPRPPKDAV